MHSSKISKAAGPSHRQALQFDATPSQQRPPFKFGEAPLAPSYRRSLPTARQGSPGLPGVMTFDSPFPVGDGPINVSCCFCDRKSTSIVCRSCGHVFHGRVRDGCAQHPGVVHLMDSTLCPSCHSASICEMHPVRPAPAALPEAATTRQPLASTSTSWNV